jgi:hypothetical protein
LVAGSKETPNVIDVNVGGAGPVGVLAALHTAELGDRTVRVSNGEYPKIKPLIFSGFSRTQKTGLLGANRGSLASLMSFISLGKTRLFRKSSANGAGSSKVGGKFVHFEVIWSAGWDLPPR